MDEKEIRAEHEAKVRRYKRLFSTEDGKKVLEDLAHFCYFRRTTYRPDVPDDILISEGKRNVFLYIKSLIERKEQFYGEGQSTILRHGKPRPEDRDEN